jgi:TonB family protein
MKGDDMGTAAFVRLGASLAVALIALPAFGDIKSFNAAVTAGDYTKAAAEAATTWPTLDKSRKDIALIAREFGFVSYVAKDYAAAKTFAEFAAAHDAEGANAAETKTLAYVLLRAADYKLKPSDTTRDALFGALEARASLPNFDNISFAAMEAVLEYDLERGRWPDALVTSDMAAKFAAAGGPYYAYELRKYELYGVVADYRVNEEVEAFHKLTTLLEAVWSDAASRKNDKTAERFVDLFWEVSAWRTTLGAHLNSRGVREFVRSDEQRQSENKERWKRFSADERMMRLIGRERPESDGESCRKTFDTRTRPEYPSSAYFRGFVGSVVLRADIAEDGKLLNSKILAAVPEKYFGNAVMKEVDGMRYKPGKPWDASTCKMAETGRIITFQFQIGAGR